MLGFIVAGAMIRDINLLFILTGMMLGPLVLSLLLAQLTLRKLTFQRRIPEVVSANDLLIVSLSAVNTGKHAGSWGVVVEDQVRRDGNEPNQPRAAVKTFFSHVPAGSRADSSYESRLRQRGRYRLGPLTATTRVPLGLIQASVTHDQLSDLLVCPRLGTLLPSWKQKLQLRREGGHKSQRAQGKMEGDYYGLRGWRSGDSRRWIHWRTSAKRNQLTVKQFEQRKSQDLAIVLELWQPADGATGTEPELAELAISFAATLVADHCRQGSSHLLVASASHEPAMLRGTSSPVFLQEVMEKLAIVAPREDDHLPEVLDEFLSRVPSDAKIVLVTTHDTNLHDTDRFADIWQDPQRRRRLTRAVTVNVSDPEFSNWFSADQRFAAQPALRQNEATALSTKTTA